MDKMESHAERARLQLVLEPTKRAVLPIQNEDERGELKRAVTPDRTDNFRARIARLYEAIAQFDNANGY